jgi:dynein heavy chain 2
MPSKRHTNQNNRTFTPRWKTAKLFFAIFVVGRENKELEVLIFREVLENIAIVDRVITKPGGSLLMAGRSGVGRRTAVSLVAHMHSIELFTPKISRGYQLKNFKNDLKTVSYEFYRY